MEWVHISSIIHPSRLSIHSTFITIALLLLLLLQIAVRPLRSNRSLVVVVVVPLSRILLSSLSLGGTPRCWEVVHSSHGGSEGALGFSKLPTHIYRAGLLNLRYVLMFHLYSIPAIILISLVGINRKTGSRLRNGVHSRRVPSRWHQQKASSISRNWRIGSCLKLFSHAIQHFSYVIEVERFVDSCYD